MFSGKLVVNVATAVSEGAAQQITVLTVDFTGLTEAQAKSFITRQVKIDLQRGWRKNGIPATAEVKVANLVSGMKMQEPVSVATEAARAKTLPAKEMAELVKMLQAELNK